ncbi:MAG: GtrA family protein [Rubritepida sp.]|nr:GtrA family protein [Rubritepida sp.]
MCLQQSVGRAPAREHKSATARRQKRPMQKMIPQFLRFGVVGTVGFLVDAAVLTALLWAGFGPYGGRVVSYLAAASTTFALNRAWTFRTASRDAPVAAQWGRFVALNMVGFVANYGTYAALIAGNAVVARYPVVGVAAGSFAGMFINFGLSRRYVFKQ